MSIATLIAISKNLKKAQKRGYKGRIRVKTERQWAEEDQENSSKRLAVLVCVCLIFSPFIVPYNVAKLISGIFAKVVEN